MDLLVSLFVGKPLVILAVAALFLAADLALRSRRPGPAQPSGGLRIAAFAWASYAGWEWLVLRSTPEADIRVDLLLIWPALLLLSAWSLWRALR